MEASELRRVINLHRRPIQEVGRLPDPLVVARTRKRSSANSDDAHVLPQASEELPKTTDRSEVLSTASVLAAVHEAPLSQDNSTSMLLPPPKALNHQSSFTSIPLTEQLLFRDMP